MPTLSNEEVLAFLQEPGHLVRIATVDEHGQAHNTPVWFVMDQGKVLVTPRERSAWWAHLQRDPRACMVIDEEALPYRKVTLRGPVEVLYGVGHDDEWRDTYRRIAERYIPPAAADRYLTDTWDEPRALVAMTLVGATTWRMPLAGEPAESRWAPRYYH